MKVKEFNIKENNLKYFVGINQIKYDSDSLIDTLDTSNEKDLLDRFFKTIDDIQNHYNNSVVQFIKDKYILNQDHIFKACYYLQKVFYNKLNISNKKGIELLLYLSTNRQIVKSIQTLGIKSSDIMNGKLLYCIISPINNIQAINDEIIHTLKANEIELTVNIQSNEKFALIKDFFEVSAHQITCILNSYGINTNSVEYEINSKFLALYDIICEKMVLLTVEKTNII